MKNFLHLIFTCFVSTFALWGALANKNNPWPCFAIAFGIWAIFLWRLNARAKRSAMKKRYDEYQFREYMRGKAYQRNR